MPTVPCCKRCFWSDQSFSLGLLQDESWIQKPSCSIASPLYLMVLYAYPSLLSFTPINTTMTHTMIYNCHLNIDSQIPPRTYIQLQWNLVHFLYITHQRHSLSTHPHSEKSHQLDSHNHSMLLSLTTAISSSNILLLACHFEHLAFHLFPLYSIERELLVSVFKALPSNPQPNLSLLHLLLQGQILFHDWSEEISTGTYWCNQKRHIYISPSASCNLLLQREDNDGVQAGPSVKHDLKTQGKKR